jgi:hypothetical protein
MRVETIQKGPDAREQLDQALRAGAVVTFKSFDDRICRLYPDYEAAKADHWNNHSGYDLLDGYPWRSSRFFPFTATYPELATSSGVETRDTNPKTQFGATKPSVGLIPPVAKLQCALAFENGAFKYGAYNWRKNSVSAMTYVHAAMRHLDAWLDGEEVTSDTGVSNLGAVMACCAILLDAQDLGILVDDRPPAGGASALQDRLKGLKKTLNARWAETKERELSAVQPEVPEKTWPAVGDVVSRDVAWAHMKACPGTQYDAFADKHKKPCLLDGDHVWRWFDGVVKEFYAQGTKPCVDDSDYAGWTFRRIADHVDKKAA